MRFNARRERISVVRLLGPAAVASVAYVDPGNVATNASAGAQFGYSLIWVVVMANLVGMLVQYLSAKLGIATGMSLAEWCRVRHGPRVARLLWGQAQLVAMATDLAEVLGGALALNLIFGTPLAVGAVATAAASFVVLSLQRAGRQRRFELGIASLLVLVAGGFLGSMLAVGLDWSEAATGLRPRLQGPESLLLASGILGATVMPHAIQLHSVLIRDRFAPRSASSDVRQLLVRATRVDIVISMTVAGLVNVGLVVVGAGVLGGDSTDSIATVHRALGQAAGPGVAMLFALALLASGIASSAVGTYAGSALLEDFLRVRLTVLARRLLTLLPAVAIIVAGVEPTRALVISQVVLSFGIPFALYPLVFLTRDASVMGRLVCSPATAALAFAATCVIVVLNGLLLVVTLGGS